MKIGNILSNEKLLKLRNGSPTDAQTLDRLLNFLKSKILFRRSERVEGNELALQTQ